MAGASGRRRRRGLTAMVEGSATAAEHPPRSRRQKRRPEFDEQTRLAVLLEQSLDSTVFWSSLENTPRTRLDELFQRRRGVKSGLPDLLVISNGQAIFVELKSRRGSLSKVQRQTRLALRGANATWLMARSARAALLGLHRSGVAFRKSFKPPQVVARWEGPTTNATLPSSPELAAAQREATRRWRERQRALRAALVATERVGGAGP